MPTSKIQERYKAVYFKLRRYEIHSESIHQYLECIHKDRQAILLSDGISIISQVNSYNTNGLPNLFPLCKTSDMMPFFMNFICIYFTEMNFCNAWSFSLVSSIQDAFEFFCILTSVSISYFFVVTIHCCGYTSFKFSFK